jgi:hypothetical protein
MWKNIDFSRISLRPQAKLNVSQPGDMWHSGGDQKVLLPV